MIRAAANVNSFNGVRNLSASDDLDTVLTAGNYLAISTPNRPSAATASGYLTVESFSDGGWIVQTWRDLQAPDVGYLRYIRPSTSTIGEWVGVQNPHSHTIGVCLGDSITANGDYPTRLGYRLGATFHNYGIGGTRMGQGSSNYDALCAYKISSAIASGDWSAVQTGADTLFTNTGADYRDMVDEMALLDWNTVSYVVLAYGTNDWNGARALGTNTDADGTTWKGSINKVITDIVGTYPHLKLIFVSPMWRSRNATGDGLESDANPNSGGIYLIEYVDALIEAANLRHWPVLDMYRESGICAETESLYLVDGLHPKSPDGYQLVADKIASFIGAKF